MDRWTKTECWKRRCIRSLESLLFLPLPFASYFSFVRARGGSDRLRAGRASSPVFDDDPSKGDAEGVGVSSWNRRSVILQPRCAMVIGEQISFGYSRIPVCEPYHQPEKNNSCVNRRLAAGVEKLPRVSSSDDGPRVLLFTCPLSPRSRRQGGGCPLFFNYLVTRVPFNQKHGNNAMGRGGCLLRCSVPIIPTRNLPSVLFRAKSDSV